MSKIVIVREFTNHSAYMTVGNAWALNPNRALEFETWEEARDHWLNWRSADPHHMTHSRVVVLS